MKYINPEITETHPGCEVDLKYGFGPIPADLTNKKIFYFDIDNCLYHRSTQIHEMMQEKIHVYFKNHLQLGDEEAHALHMNYYKTYGLALEGLVRNHQVDALEYNRLVDDSLDLKLVLLYNEPLREMLIRIKESQEFDHFWLLTNAYKNHALRVVSFLGIGDLFEGLTFCDYAQFPIVCKPMKPFFDKCLKITNVDDEHKKDVYFVDDSELNVKAALKFGWGHIFHYIELDEDYQRIKSKEDFHAFYTENKEPGKIRIIRHILELENTI